MIRTIGEPTADFIGAPELSADEQSVVVFLQRTGDNDIWIIELAWSPAWLRRFRFGPAEWLWRSLTYWKLQPIA